MTLDIYAEKFDGDRWCAKPAKLYYEDIRGHLTGESWLEPELIYGDRNDKLSEILGISLPFNDLIQIVPQPRGFPEDISEELIDYFARRYLHDWDNEPRDWQLIRQRAKSLKFSQSWLLLEELLRFNWQGQYQRYYGEVKKEYAYLFGSGQQPFPSRFIDKKTVPIVGSCPYPDKLLWNDPYEPGKVRVSWLETYADEVGSKFMNEVLPLLQTFGAPHEVRIVCWKVP